MKIIKKCALGLSTIGLTLSLSACGNDKEDENEGEIGVSNVLNSKEMLPIVVTEGENKAEKDHIIWAGFIGQGKVKAMNLDGPTYYYAYKDLKKLDDKEFNESIIEMGKDFEPYSREYITSKTDVQLTTSSDSETSDENKTEKVSLDYLNDDEDVKVSTVRDLVSNPVYSKVKEKSEDDEWSTIKTTETNEKSDYKGYEMHIKLGAEKQSNLKLEDAKKAEKDYDNVKVDEVDDEDYS